MRRDFYPDREAEMVVWGRSFVRALSEREGHFGVPVDRLDEIAQAQAEFESAYAAAVNPQTRTRGAVAWKNDCRRAMERLARSLARYLSANPAVSDADRANLGLTVPKQRVRHAAPPASAPIVEVVDVDGADVTIRLHDAQRRGRRARPDGAEGGATIMYHVGEHPPASAHDWKYATATTATRLTLPFENRLPEGATVWICAWWVNRRREASPTSQPVRVRISEGRPRLGNRRGIIGGPWFEKKQSSETRDVEATAA